MAEYIVVSVPDEKDLTCFDCERDTCAEVGCPHAPSVVTARPKERIVRCLDCKHDGEYWNLKVKKTYREMDCTNCEPDGFCAWGEPKD